MANSIKWEICSRCDISTLFLVGKLLKHRRTPLIWVNLKIMSAISTWHLSKGQKNGLPHLSHRLERHQGSIQGVLAGAKNIAKPEKRKWQLMPIRINDMIDMYSTKWSLYKWWFINDYWKMSDHLLAGCLPMFHPEIFLGPEKKSGWTPSLKISERAAGRASYPGKASWWYHCLESNSEGGQCCWCTWVCWNFGNPKNQLFQQLFVQRTTSKLLYLGRSSPWFVGA